MKSLSWALPRPPLMGVSVTGLAVTVNGDSHVPEAATQPGPSGCEVPGEPTALTGAPCSAHERLSCADGDVNGERRKKCSQPSLLMLAYGEKRVVTAFCCVDSAEWTQPGTHMLTGALWTRPSK